MPSISTNDFKNGITLELDNGLFTVVEFQHVKPGKGGAFVRTKLRNVRNGNLLEKTFNAGIKVEQAMAQELAQLLASGITEAELQDAKKSLEQQRLTSWAQDSALPSCNWSMDGSGAIWPFMTSCICRSPPPVCRR